MDAIVLASAGVAVLFIGGGIGYWAGRAGIGGSKTRADKAEAELDEYKRNVTEHFGQTAAHFQAIGKQYRELYEHMSNGAQVLCEPDEAGKQLLFAPGASAASTDVDEHSAVADTAADVRPPVDYVEDVINEETAAAPEVVEAPADDQRGELADTGERAKTDGTEETAPETAAEQQPEAEAETGDRTLH